MTQEVSELLKKALTLPPEGRAALAGSLLESLDDTVDASAEQEWNEEFARRIEERDDLRVHYVHLAAPLHADGPVTQVHERSPLDLVHHPAGLLQVLQHD